MKFRDEYLVPAGILAAFLGMAVEAQYAAADAAPAQLQTQAPMHQHMVMNAAPISAPVNANTVAVRNFAFGPNAITVVAGTTVTWTNQDNEPHSVVAVDQSFRTAPMDTGDSVRHTFTTPGTYRYFCGFHPQMIGVVNVYAANG
jgi:plastocyanin